MQMVLALFAGARSADHRAVFDEFARVLARVLARRKTTARVRMMGG
jgi:hypothetical protein